jgi:hypothetical protein
MYASFRGYELLKLGGKRYTIFTVAIVSLA